MYLGVVFQFLSGTTIALLLQFVELAGDVSSVAIQHGCISGRYLSRVGDDNHLKKVCE